MQAKELFEPPMVELLQNIREGDEIKARQQLSRGLDLNIHGKDGIPPLLWLIYETRDKKAVRLALKLGADPNFKNGSGDNAVNWVAGAKDPDWLRMILDAGGDPNSLDRNKQPPYFSAINEERWADVELLYERGGDVNLQDGARRNSALYAAFLNQYDFVFWFIEHGAKIDGYATPGADLAWVVHDSESIISHDSPQYPWLMKVKQQLIDRGVKFPPRSPAEIQALWAKGEQP